MHRVILTIAILTMAVMGDQIENWGGFRDTSRVTAPTGTNTEYSKAFQLGNYENIAAQVKVNDTVVAGFASDSGKMLLRYQVGYPSLDSAAKRDTVWMPGSGILLDTVDLIDGAGTLKGGYHDSTGTLYLGLGELDTLQLAGWATKEVQFSPPWAPLIRYMFTGVTGKNPAYRTRLVVHHQFRLGQSVEKK